MTEENTIDIRGMRITMEHALFDTGDEGVVINGADKSISNGHWAVFSGTSDLSFIRKVVLTKAKKKSLVWSKPWKVSNGKLFESNTDIRQHCVGLWFDQDYRLAEDFVLLLGDGSKVILSGYIEVTPRSKGDNEYFELVEELEDHEKYNGGEDEVEHRFKKGDEPYEVPMNPSYYFAFRKQGFQFLVSSETHPILLVREEEGKFSVRGCVMPLLQG